jgi:hypothetical protein
MTISSTTGELRRRPRDQQVRAPSALTSSECRSRSSRGRGVAPRQATPLPASTLVHRSPRGRGSPSSSAYAKNDHLDFEIPYEWEGATHVYRPDFLVRIGAAEGERNLIVEVKGQEREQDRAKYEAAKKWARAVNHHGGFGAWAFVVCREPNRLGQTLTELGVGTAAA